MEDNIVIAHIMKGDSHYFRHIVNAHKDRLFNIVHTIINDEDSCNEIVQESFIKAYSYLKTYKAEAQFSTWLIRITINETNKFLKRTKRLNINYVDSFERELASHENHAEQKEKADYVQYLLTQLPTLQQTILTLYYIDGLDTKEIAYITDLSISNVKIQLFRARKILVKFVTGKK